DVCSSDLERFGGPGPQRAGVPAEPFAHPDRGDAQRQCVVLLGEADGDHPGGGAGDLGGAVLVLDGAGRAAVALVSGGAAAAARGAERGDPAEAEEGAAPREGGAGEGAPSAPGPPCCPG